MFDTVQRVRDLALERGLTFHQFCEQYGVLNCYQNVMMAQTRNGQVQLDTIEAICEAADIPLFLFFTTPEEVQAYARNQSLCCRDCQL